MSKVSSLLQSEEEYFKLRVLFEKFILPILIPRAKVCAKLEADVLEIGELFILGFLNHCDLGKEGIACCLRNIEKVKSK